MTWPARPSFERGPWTPRPCWGDFLWSISTFDIEYACALLGVRPGASTRRPPHQCIYYVLCPNPPTSVIPFEAPRLRGPVVKIGTTGYLRDRWLHLTRTHGATQLLAIEIGAHEQGRHAQFAHHRLATRSEFFHPRGLLSAFLQQLGDELAHPPRGHS